MNILKAGILVGLMAPMAMAQENNFSSAPGQTDKELALTELEWLTGEWNKSLNEAWLNDAKQADQDAKRIDFQTDPKRYFSALKDRYYGYKLFFLVDKSKSKGPSTLRVGKGVEPQTLYIYERVGDELQLIKAFPVSTGKESAPGSSDTREGFTRIQSAMAGYKSKKYGTAMAYSLWFESEYGTAIHETTPESCQKIGTRASAGCIRLCPGTSHEVFNLVMDKVGLKRVVPDDRLGKGADTEIMLGKDAIVFFHRKKGLPYKMDSGFGTVNATRVKSPNHNEMAEVRTVFQEPPTVIEGFPVFVRIIDDTNSPEKRQELNDIIANPTKGFQKYFVPFDIEAVKSKLIPSI